MHPGKAYDKSTNVPDRDRLCIFAAAFASADGRFLGAAILEVCLEGVEVRADDDMRVYMYNGSTSGRSRLNGREHEAGTEYALD